ncbi:MAG: hypothetical protein H7249_15095 [Chitinophagaceae bacterium]|nr:hypothetical protein [Oligoflexus sp.]
MGRVSKYFLALCLSFVLLAESALAIVLPKRDQVLKKANDLLEHWSISYVYGGATLGDPRNCEACNQCLDQKKSTPNTRLTDCPVCTSCSLDCSHYTYEVFKQAGLGATYLTTSLMNTLPASELAGRYNLLDIGPVLARAMPGDLLVYEGHVVLLEKKYTDGRGDVIHVTSGRELRGPGNGIQRERRAEISRFHGPVLRILRHLDLAKEMRDLVLQRRTGSAN